MPTPRVGRCMGEINLMNRNRLLALACLWACLITSAAFAQQDIIDDVWHLPADMIHSGDRVTVAWSILGAPADSVRIDFNDGFALTAGPGETSAEHVYLDPGAYDLDLTAWRDGVSDSRRLREFTRVEPRPYCGNNMMFLHHSTGRYILRDAGVRSIVESEIGAKNGSVRFWDHDYHSGNIFTGIIDPDSTVHKTWSYGWQANYITPAGYQTIFCTDVAFRDSLFSRHDVIAFKNDHSTGDIATDAQLAEYKQLALEIRDVFDAHPEKLFIYLSGPPRRPEDSRGPGQADRAREFYRWLGSPEYVNGHPNLVFFDLFDLLASADDPADPERNMLRPEYRVGSDGSTDSHPNTLANVTIGPILADFFSRMITPQQTTGVGDGPLVPALSPTASLLPNAPNPFNPITVLRYEMHRPGLVSLQVFDLSGRRIRVILEPTHQDAGMHTIRWDGRDGQGRALPSGVYITKLDAGGGIDSRRVTLVR